MAYTDPTIASFKARFFRDFPYGGTSGDLTTVQDADIQNALNLQQNTINQTLFPAQNLYTEGALLLAAHYMTINLRASALGIAGKWDWLIASKGAGAVQSAYVIPERIRNNPELAILCTSIYGAQFVFLILPLLTGQMFSVAGGTLATGGNNALFWPIGPWGGPFEIPE